MVWWEKENWSVWLVGSGVGFLCLIVGLVYFVVVFDVGERSWFLWLVCCFWGEWVGVGVKSISFGVVFGW